MALHKCSDLNYCGTHEPCLFGGTCHHIGGEQFSCTCPEGLSGARCEIVEHPCAPVPCKNGATCTVKEPLSARNATAKPEYKPRQYRGMSSMGAPVSARTVAVNDSLTLSSTTKTETDYVCTCPPGFAGERCEQSKYEISLKWTFFLILINKYLISNIFSPFLFDSPSHSPRCASHRRRTRYWWMRKFALQKRRHLRRSSEWLSMRLRARFHRPWMRKQRWRVCQQSMSKWRMHGHDQRFLLPLPGRLHRHVVRNNDKWLPVLQLQRRWSDGFMRLWTVPQQRDLRVGRRLVSVRLLGGLRRARLPNQYKRMCLSTVHWWVYLHRWHRCVLLCLPAQQTREEMRDL